MTVVIADGFCWHHRHGEEILDQQIDAWGVKVINVAIKHVDLNERMIRAIAKQAAAERLRRADGEPLNWPFFYR